MLDRNQSLLWLTALSILTGALGQFLLLSAAPHAPAAAPHLAVSRLASLLHSSLPAHRGFPKA